MKRMKLFSTLLIAIALVMAALPTGALAADDATGPITSAVAVAPNPATIDTTVTVTATADDSTTGSSNIQGAEFNVNGGDYTAMTASDGAFDSPTEGVTASFTTSEGGDFEVCVRATDSAKNTGEPACTTLTVEYLYEFNGFRPPIRMNKENKANAGRTVPVKWKLTLTADGSPVSDPSSIVGAKSYLVDCTTHEGDPSTAVTEKSPGKSGLRYLKGGNWMFNWKTPKSYAGTCRMFFVELSDGQISPEVLFTFK